MERTLVEIPEIHGLADILGRLLEKYTRIAERTNQSFEEVLAANRAEQEEEIRKFQGWAHILIPFFEQLVPFVCQYEPAVLYSDGITSEDELSTVTFRSEHGEIIDSLILYHAGRGAKLIPTEDKSALEKSTEANISGDTDALLDSIPERDRGIAERICETLPEGAVGILFVGAGHNVGAKLKELDPDITIIRPEFAKETFRKYTEICCMPTEYGLINPENWR